MQRWNGTGCYPVRVIVPDVPNFPTPVALSMWLTYLSADMNSILGSLPMLPLTLGVLVYSLFMRVGCSVCHIAPDYPYLSLTPA